MKYKVFQSFKFQSGKENQSDPLEKINVNQTSYWYFSMADFIFFELSTKFLATKTTFAMKGAMVVNHSGPQAVFQETFLPEDGASKVKRS